ncbi:MAG: response regulator transcription factor [Chloroflexota bacterium]
MISVVLVDDHHIVRRGLRNFLESFSDIQVIGESPSGEELLTKLNAWQPDVVIMDLLLPGGIDGIETTKQVRSRSLQTQVVVLTASTDEARLVGALREGAIGYVRKDADPATLLEAVRGAACGQTVLDPQVAGHVMEELVERTQIIDELTPREKEVLQRLTHGRTNREIAETLSISEETVKTHIGRILSKLHLAHRNQAMLYALKQGLVTLDEIDFPF